MMSQRLLVVLTFVNGALLLVTLAERRPVVADDVVPVLRGRALEIVDEEGRVRASLNVFPAQGEAGARSPETVLLRLITEQGRPSVKLAATEEGSGLSFAGPTGTSNTWVTLEARGETSTLTLRGERGGEKVVTPH